MCQQNASGVTEKMLQKEMSSVDKFVRVKAINELLTTGKIKLGRIGSAPVYLAADSGANEGTDDEEKVVYAIIREAGNKGIWNRDIRNKSNLSMTVLNKVIKSLEGRKIIKAVKSVAASKKKVYMLYNLEPDLSVTGGAWYSSDQDFEADLVDILRKYTQRFLIKLKNEANEQYSRPIERKKHSHASANQVLSHIKESGILKIAIGLGEIESILQTLVFDSLVEKDDLNSVYRALEPMAKSSGLMSVPCGVCPVFNDCSVDGKEISPINCVYMDNW